MKTKMIVIGAIIWTFFYALLYGQIRSDFVLAEDATQPRIAIDKTGNLHATWLDRTDNLAYGMFDSLGNQKNGPRQFGGGFFTFNPKIALGEEYGVILYDAAHPSAEIGFGGILFTIAGEEIPGLVDVLDDLGGNTFHPDITFLTDTTFFVVWSDNFKEIFGQTVTTHLRFIGPSQILSHQSSQNLKRFSPRVATQTTSDRLVTVWREENSSTSDKIFGRVILKNGIPQDSTFLISDTPDTFKAFFPTPTMTLKGEFMVVWSDRKLDNTANIYLRCFRSDGTPMGQSQKINTMPAMGAAEVDIAMDLNGRFIVVWESLEKNRNSKIFGQRFAKDGMLIGNNFKIAVKTDSLPQFWPNVVLYNRKIYTAWTTREGVSTFKIWLNILDFDNPIVRVEDQSVALPAKFQLFQNYPNPFNPTTTISYSVIHPAHIQLAIFNTMGEEVITLINKKVMPGTYQIVWDGRDANGKEMVSGVYFYQLRSDNNIKQTQKMVFVR
ncbi:MAG: T9SS type A sorting domain-containing protein [Nitrososphaera sp.]